VCRRWAVVLVTAQALLRPSFAQIPPTEFPPSGLPRVAASSKMDSRLTADLRLGNVRIHFEKTGLLALGVDMHNLVIGHTRGKGDEDGSSWLCFTVVRDFHAERWWLMSDDQFGGAPDYAITGVIAERLKPPAVPTTTCPEPPPQFAPASLDQHLWLGSRASAIESVLGRKPPSTGWHRYTNVTEQTDSHGTEWFVQSWLDVKLESGVIVALRAVQMTSS
jgi:hypothetical protein